MKVDFSLSLMKGMAISQPSWTKASSIFFSLHPVLASILTVTAWSQKAAGAPNILHHLRAKERGKVKGQRG